MATKERKEPQNDTRKTESPRAFWKTLNQSPASPVSVVGWMVRQYRNGEGIFIGVGLFAPSAIIAARPLEKEVFLVTWGEPFENPVMTTKFRDLRPELQSWWAFVREGQEERGERYLFRSVAGRDSLWFEVRNKSVGSWETGEAIAGVLIDRHPYFQKAP